MNWTGRAWRMGCAIGILALAACGTGSAPNDVSEGVGFQDYQEYQARRAALRAPQPVAPQTALPPASVVAEPFAPEPPATSQWVAVDPAQTARTGSVDVARIAAGAIAEAEGTIPAPATAPVAVSPTEMATAPTGDDFVAPPLPEGMSVVGATVVAFALTTQHAVGERVYSRFPLRLGRREVQCSDFRTTDLAQDWFLTNEGPERDRAGLDPDGDGFACNWSPERYREEARAATQLQTFGTLQDG
jgi:hypothetical protein